jgi:hypothetical protein
VLKVKLRVISGLAERSLGVLERAPIASLGSGAVIPEKIPGGESLVDFNARVRECLDFILSSSQAGQEGHPLIVTHGLFARAIFSVLSSPNQILERCRHLCRESVERRRRHWWGAVFGDDLGQRDEADPDPKRTLQLGALIMSHRGSFIYNSSRSLALPAPSSVTFNVIQFGPVSVQTLLETYFRCKDFSRLQR